jgi:large subunit ribosomal protein L18
MSKYKQFQKRKIKIRAKLRKITDRLRLTVFRSHKHIYAQIIDDRKAITLLSASDGEINQEKKMTKSELARQVGLLLARKTKNKQLGNLYLDRGGYKYAGRIKALAEGARKGGLKF